MQNKVAVSRLLVRKSNAVAVSKFKKVSGGNYFDKLNIFWEESIKSDDTHLIF